MTLELRLIDMQPALCEAWRREFQGLDVAVNEGDLFASCGDAVVSPANCTGVMDGGLDEALRDFFGPTIEEVVRRMIHEAYQGELPVGHAIAVPTTHPQFPFLIASPTMRTPGDVSRTINAYLSMTALLRVALQHPDISSVVVPGLCSASGRMPPALVARQMRAAYERVVLRRYVFPHWIYEVDFERFLRCEIEAPRDPKDFER